MSLTSEGHRRNKANLPAEQRWTRARQASGAAWGPSVRNKANFARAERDGCGRATPGVEWPLGSLRQTKPIPRPAMQGRGPTRMKPNRPWGRSCQTKPIGPQGQDEARAGNIGSGIAVGVPRAKQSQFALSHAKHKRLPNKDLCTIQPPDCFGETKPISRGEPAGPTYPASLGPGAQSADADAPPACQGRGKQLMHGSAVVEWQ